MSQFSLHTPVGDITVFEEDGAIVAVDWGWALDQRTSAVLGTAREQLQGHFDGELKAFGLPMAPAGTTYSRLVWRAVCGILFGETRSYRDIPASAGGSARSVEQANGKSPIPLIIPCHRVVAITHIGGYSGGDGLTTKRWLLGLENPNRIFF